MLSEHYYDSSKDIPTSREDLEWDDFLEKSKIVLCISFLSKKIKLPRDNNS